MTADAYITCRVSSETKARVRALARREGINESALVRRLLEGVLCRSSVGEMSPPEAPESVNGTVRLGVRLAPEIGRLLRERARARGMASATYLSSLARSHLLGAAPLPKVEYVALMQSVAAVAAIGRNLGQIARTLNQGERAALPGNADVGALVKLAEGLRDHFKALLNANARSWETGHAQASH